MPRDPEERARGQVLFTAIMKALDAAGTTRYDTDLNALISAIVAVIATMADGQPDSPTLEEILSLVKAGLDSAIAAVRTDRAGPTPILQ